MAEDGTRFGDVQREYFDLADRDRFRFLTSGPGFSATEDALLAPFVEKIRPPFLEIGCGEGGNLARLASRGRCVGVDLFFPKVAFARLAVPGPAYASADGVALPFRDRCFESVFIRDVLHHVADPRAVVREAARVLVPDGQLLLIEPNGRNPIVRLQAMLVAAERESRRFHTAFVRDLLEGFEIVDVATAHPLPLRRLLFHYRWGLPRLAEIGWTRSAITRLELFLSRFVPAAYWEHVVATAQRPR